LDDKPKRIKVVYYDEKMAKSYKEKLKFFEEIYNEQ
jgi:hypothetical protein